jgi:L-2-hydroxyglutarate oxidase LhgO
MPDYQVAVIGAGVVGLAVAADLAPRATTLVIEKQWKFGQASSSHNSEVVHAGLYYSPGSLKARLCVEGNRLIRELAISHGIAYAQVGKFVVAANEEEIEYLKWLKENAAANGVSDLRWVSLDELREHEPSVRAQACLFSPTSGIVDSHALMSYFKNVAEKSGADFAFNSELVSARLSPSTLVGGLGGVSDAGGQGGRSSFFELTIRDSSGSLTRITTDRVINCAGLYADRIAALFGLNVEALRLDLLWAKGYYFSLEGGPKLGIRHLVYPVPDKSLKSLGVHATVDLEGGLRFGPTAEYMPEKIEDYSFADAPTQQVAESISHYLPGVDAAQLTPMMSGIRPRLTRPGESPRDFYIREESERGLPGLVNLIGIESPGLTAAPAIAKYVSRLLR